MEYLTLTIEVDCSQIDSIWLPAQTRDLEKLYSSGFWLHKEWSWLVFFFINWFNINIQGWSAICSNRSAIPNTKPPKHPILHSKNRLSTSAYIRKLNIVATYSSPNEDVDFLPVLLDTHLSTNNRAPTRKEFRLLHQISARLCDTAFKNFLTAINLKIENNSTPTWIRSKLQKNQRL